MRSPTRPSRLPANRTVHRFRVDSFWLVLWLEQPGRDPVNVVPFRVTPQNIGIELSGSYATTIDHQFDSGGTVITFKQPTNYG